jgi:uracil-DNA glycosylase family 4
MPNETDGPETPQTEIMRKMIGYRAALDLPEDAPCVFGSGPVPPVAVVLGGMPDAASESARMPFMGMAGQLLGGMISGAGLEETGLYKTYVVKHRVTRAGNVAEVRKAAWPFLKKELKIIGKPQFEEGAATGLPGCRILIALGETPLLMLAGREGLRKIDGTVFPVMIGKQEWTVLASFDPEQMVRNSMLKRGGHQHFRVLAGLING